jgi:hypothetical protein
VLDEDRHTITLQAHDRSVLGLVAIEGGNI